MRRAWIPVKNYPLGVGERGYPLGWGTCVLLIRLILCASQSQPRHQLLMGVGGGGLPSGVGGLCAFDSFDSLCVAVSA